MDGEFGGLLGGAAHGHLTPRGMPLNQRFRGEGVYLTSKGILFIQRGTFSSVDYTSIEG